MITTINEWKQINKYYENDAIGYDIGKYLYHVTPKENLKNIKRNGFEPNDGTTIRGEDFENRLYFATSLIAAYDLSVNFSSYKTDEDLYIIKLKSDCIDKNDYEEDPLFLHGIYIDYNVSNNCIISIIEADDLFNKFDDEDIENLYL